jgi:protocatechuate 3,4-dioxygenase beta subunit
MPTRPLPSLLRPTDGHDDFGGLSRDLPLLRRFERRDVLRAALGLAVLPAFPGCGVGTDGGGETGDGNASCAKTPPETAGPFPGNGSNGPNVLGQSGVVRSDLRSSFGTASGTAGGVLLTVKLTVVSAAGGCAPLAGRAVYLWHCDREGRYSLYSPGVTGQNYLRGVQETDASGELTFTTVFPGCYPGRWPHMHFEVYPSLAVATSASSKVATSQLALPAAACNEAYATAGYEGSVTSLRGVSLASDGVFAGDLSTQLASVTGNATDGYVARLVVAL